MKYFKNTELAKIYHVSEKSVRNWIQATKEGKLDLQLHEENGRIYVANTLKNTALIEELVKKGKKYKNTRGAKTISPKPDFYTSYSDKQILNILSDLAIRKEIPLQYGYANGGAASWDRYAGRLMNEQTPNILTETIELLDLTANNVDRLLAGYQTVNVIDLGPGNGLPIRSTLHRLIEQGRLGRYIAIDISQEMLNILQKNIEEWFGGAVTFESYVRDISYERFDDLIDKYTGRESANLVYLLGGTLSNFRSPDQVLQVVNNSLGIDDLFFYSGYLDTPEMRRYFNFDFKDPKDPARLILDYLNIDESLRDIEPLFVKEKRAREQLIWPKMDLTIRLVLEGKVRSIELRKNEPILVWRHKHYDIQGILALLEKNDFDLLQATKSEDQNYVLLMSKIKTNN